MVNLRSEIVLSLGVNLHPWQEHALAAAVDTDRAALAVSTATARADLSVGVNLRYDKSCSSHGSLRRELLYPCLLPWLEHALAVGVNLHPRRELL